MRSRIALCVGAMLTALALATAVPAATAAKHTDPCKGLHGDAKKACTRANKKPKKPKKPGKTHKCVAHAVSYEVSGTVLSGTTLTQTGKHTFSGTLRVHVTKANDHAKADKGMDKTYTLTNAHVSFGHGVNHSTPAAGSKVKAKGTITTVPKKCPPITPIITIHKVEIQRAKS